MKEQAPARKKAMSLHMVILCCFFATVGALLLFMAGMLMPRVSSLLETNAVDRTRETVQQSTNSLEVYMDNMVRTLHFVGSILPDETVPQDAGFLGQLELLRKGQQGVQNIAFFGETGGLIYSTTGQLSVPADDIRALEWFQRAREWQGTIPYFSVPHVQHIFQGQHQWVVTVSKAVDYMVAGQAHTGVLLVDYDFSTITQLGAGVQLGASGYAYVVNTNDEIIFHPRQQLLYAGLAKEDMEAVRRQVVGVCRDVQEGRERVLIINPVSQTRWRMVGVAYIDEITQLQSAFLRMFTIALICGGLLSLAAATATAYFVTRPIHYLQRKMRQVEEGNLHTAVTVGGFEEIRSLSETFSRMLERIRGLMTQLVSEQEAKRLHELNALQAQINPHFLYNTLDSIIWMEERGRSKEAIAMVSALAKLFRISISKGRNIITLREEMEHVRNYLIIQKMRFRNKFTYDIDAPEELLNLQTVKLIVQPLVENAVHHAIDAYDEAASMHISITARLEENRLVITVQDDGIGIPQEKLESILRMPPGKSGIGLRNVHERIQLTCGRDFGLVVESVEEEGTTVRIYLPANLEG